MIVQKSLIAQLPVEWRERRRLQRRFARIEKVLRARDCSHLRPALQQKRSQTLDNLNRYARRGIFPRNFEYPNQPRPVFIDPGGRTCAVAQLMVDSGAQQHAVLISNQANFAYIREMNFPELDSWVKDSGLTVDEAAWIQPTYRAGWTSLVSHPYLPLLLIAITVTSVFWFVQGRLPQGINRFIARRMIVIGIVCSILLLTLIVSSS